MLYITNGFSLNMLDPKLRQVGRHIVLQSAQTEDICYLVTQKWREGKIVNAIGHADIDQLARNYLEALTGIDPGQGQRLSVSVSDDDMVLVAQYIGPRLPEGTTSLPEGAVIEWYLIEL